MAYFWFKAFHIIGVVVWFAGLFYLVRLFIYHAEAAEKPEPARSILQKQYELMEKRLYNIITNPGMFVTVAMATGLVVSQPDLLQNRWLQVKLGFVAVLLVYHFYCARIMKQQIAGECKWSSQQLRALNEAPTLLLVVIVMLAVFKNSLPTDATVWVIVGLIVTMVATIQLYAKIRRKNEAKMAAEAEATSLPANS